MNDKTQFKRRLLGTAIATAIGTAGIAAPVSADIVGFSLQGLFTTLVPDGTPLQNSSKPYYYDATWGYGYRTQIAGTLSYDTSTGTGTATIDPVQWFGGHPEQPFTFHDINLQSIGDGNGGAGPLIQADMLHDWNGSYNVNTTVIWDASGLLAGAPYTVGDVVTGGATPATDGTVFGSSGTLPIGPAPLATTTYDSAFPLSGDGIGGVPAPNGFFVGINHNLDITSLTVTSVSAVPLPAAAWLFGSGLLGLVSLARRSRGTTG